MGEIGQVHPGHLQQFGGAFKMARHVPQKRHGERGIVGDHGAKFLDPDAKEPRRLGRHQIEVNEWCIAAGGHTRTGLEDNVRLDRDTLAPSNAALVARAAALCEKYGRPVATPAQAREILELRSSA